MALNRNAFRLPRNYHLAVLSELAAPAARALTTFACGTPTTPSSWRKGLIISHTHIGDVLYRTGSLPRLARAFPGCEWSYLCSDESAPILQGRDDVSPLPLVAGEDSWTLKAGAFTSLRKLRFDVALCTNTLRHYPDLLLSVGLGIPNRVAYHYKGLSGLMTNPIDVDYPSPFPVYFRSMVSQLAGLSEDWPVSPTIFLSAIDIELAGRYWDTLRLDGQPVIACCPVTRQPVGGWPPADLFMAAEEAARVMRGRVLLCGGPADRPALDALASRATGECEVIAGALPLRSFASLLARCTSVVAQDSAPRHLANAVGTPVAFLRNISVSRVETGHYCETEIDAAPDDEFVAADRLAEVFAKVPPGVIAEKIVSISSRR